MPPTPRALTAATVLPCAALALTGCAKTVRESDVEAKITRNLQGRMPARTISVDCPGGQEARKGTAFRCAVRIDGRAAVADVRLLSDERFRFRLHSPGRG